MSYNIIVDNNESALIKVLQKCFPQVYVSDFEIGDIAICKIDNGNAKILALFERKTIQDMLSSIIDGRYREQKIRLMSYHLNKKTNKLYYLLEGDTNELSKEDDKKLWGAWISTQIRDGIEVIRTSDLQETVKFLIRFVERLISDGDALLEISKYKRELCQSYLPLDNTTDDKQNSLSYLATIKSKKKDNITPKICQIMSLGLIPNVSHAGAEAVISKYGSLVNLMKAYSNVSDEDDKKLLLADIQVSEKRKLGKVSSEKIYNYLFC